MSFADFLENELLDQIFGAQAYVAPATLYVALSTTTPSDDGTNFTEPSGNAYARVAVTNNKTNFNTAAAGAVDNAVSIDFAQATPAGWGTVTHFGIYDASSAGNLLAWGALTASKAIDALDTAKFAAGDLNATLD